MKHDTTTIKSNVRFFLCGIVLSLYIDSKIILQERLCENGKLQKLEPSRNENSTLGKRSSEIRWKCLLSQIKIYKKIEQKFWLSGVRVIKIQIYRTSGQPVVLTSLKQIDFVADLVSWMINFWKLCTDYILLLHIIKLNEKS